MTETITGKLTDFALMTEGQHAGRYGARIDDKPYPVMAHVDAFLLRLQKGSAVDVNLNKDGWISKIQRSKKPTAAKKEPSAEEIAQQLAVCTRDSPEGDVLLQTRLRRGCQLPGPALSQQAGAALGWNLAFPIRPERNFEAVVRGCRTVKETG